MNGFAQGIARHWLISGFVVLVVIVAVALASMVVAMGAYNVAADEPHTKPVYWLMQTVRDRSIAVRARNIAVPADLSGSKRIAAGAGLYNEMCTSCHLGPGLERTEISQGLYPRAPKLARGVDLSPAEEFWVIKHGIKMTGMAAWGPTHNDTLIWDMVAFLRKLPKLTPAQYQAIVKSAPEDHDQMMRDMPGMSHSEDDGHQ